MDVAHLIRFGSGESLVVERTGACDGEESSIDNWTAPFNLTASGVGAGMLEFVR
jgi:hypothetical protein